MSLFKQVLICIGCIFIYLAFWHTFYLIKLIWICIFGKFAGVHNGDCFCNWCDFGVFPDNRQTCENQEQNNVMFIDALWSIAPHRAKQDIDRNKYKI